jgi:Fic family protein
MSQLLERIEEKTERLRGILETQEETFLEEFNRRLDTSWIYHDNALEGIVLSHHELNSSVDDAIISDVTLIPQYQELRNHKEAIAFTRGIASKRKSALGLEFLKKLHLILSNEPTLRTGRAPAKPPPVQYRKDNPLHRLYFHEIAPPDKISYHMRKLVQWIASDEAKKLHPIKRAAFAHHKLITIYPWPRHSGKVSRLLMNGFLLRDGFLPAIIHAVERQRYYEVLRQPPGALTELVAESVNRTVESALKLFEENATVQEAS